MDKFKELQDRYNDIMYIDGQFISQRIMTPLGKALIVDITNTPLGDFISLNEKISAIRFNIIERPKCPVCGSVTKLRRGKFEINCSRKCSGKNPIAQQLRLAGIQKARLSNVTL